MSYTLSGYLGTDASADTVTVAVASYRGDLAPTVCESTGGVICVAPAGNR